MRIGIDARVLSKKMTGIGRYLIAILENLNKYDNKNEYILFSDRELKIKIDRYETVIRGSSRLPEKLYSPFWLNFILPGLLKEFKIDLLYCPNQLTPFKLDGCKTVISINDVFHQLDKNFHSWLYRKYLDLQLPHSIKNSSAIISISNNTKLDLVKLYKVEPEKITVIHLEAGSKFSPIKLTIEETEKLRKKYDLPRKFILYVGVIENRKNILGILKISDLVNKINPEIRTVMIGRAGFGFKNLIPEIKKRHDHVLYLNFVEDEYINLIYNSAFVFLFPSFYEGFGLPPLEAMQCGLPALVSNSSSLNEVVGENGLLFAPNDYDSFAREIIRLSEDPDYYNLRVQESLKQAGKFTIDNSMKKLMQVFNKIK